MTYRGCPRFREHHRRAKLCEISGSAPDVSTPVNDADILQREPNLAAELSPISAEQPIKSDLHNIHRQLGIYACAASAASIERLRLIAEIHMVILGLQREEVGDCVFGAHASHPTQAAERV